LISAGHDELILLLMSSASDRERSVNEAVVDWGELCTILEALQRDGSHALASSLEAVGANEEESAAVD